MAKSTSEEGCCYLDGGSCLLHLPSLQPPLNHGLEGELTMATFSLVPAANWLGDVNSQFQYLTSLTHPPHHGLSRGSHHG
jgi:hypothetical protein